MNHLLGQLDQEHDDLQAEGVHHRLSEPSLQIQKSKPRAQQGGDVAAFDRLTRALPIEPEQIQPESDQELIQLH